MPGRFPRAHKVRKRAEFQTIQAKGRRISTPRLVLLLSAREGDASGERLGITVTRRVGNAVVRNRAKRLIREAFRATRELWPPDIDLVVIVRHATPGWGLQDVVDELEAVRGAIRRRVEEARRDRQKPAAALANPR